MRRNIVSLITCIFLFTSYFLYKIFGAFFIAISPILNINYWLFLFAIIYFILWFSIFLLLRGYGVIGVFLHSVIMITPSFFKIALPLHPFILLYPQYGYLLPVTSYSLLNLFCLFFVSGLFFCQSSNTSKLISLLIILLISWTMKHDESKNTFKHNNIRIAVVQVGLYFEKGGNTTDFFNDLIKFIDKNPDVDSIVFSENNVFSFKTPYNKELAEKLLQDIKNSNLQQKISFFLSFNGYKEFNNIVTLYMFKNNTHLNQKKALIPFIEKRGLFNRESNINSVYYQIYDSHVNKSFRVKDSSVSTFICYDALFPEVTKKNSEVILIQSNYRLLDKGFGHDKLKYLATYLARFLNGMQSKVIINIQNYGGTVVLYDNWRINNDIYEKSKNEPFIIVDLDIK